MKFAAYTARLMSQPDLLSAMRRAAREQALTTSWDRIFEGMYEAYARCLSAAPVTKHSLFDVATT
jgi:hypothetical protein